MNETEMPAPDAPATDAPAPDAPASDETIEITGAIFGNTIGKMEAALDTLAVGGVLKVHTNDP